jgi:SAM-dependent methyltransferase
MTSRYEDGSYFEANPTLDCAHGPFKAREILKGLRRNNFDPKRILEIGCGSGAIISALCADLPDAVGVGYDIASRHVEFARRYETDRLRYVHGDAMQDPGHYDLVVMCDVFEHVDDYLGFLRQARAKADLFAFHIPLEISVLAVLRPHTFDLTREDAGHLHIFNVNTALATLKHAGYRVVDYHYTPGALTNGATTWRNALANVPRAVVGAVSRGLAQQWLGGYSLMVLAQPDDKAP